MKKRRGFIGPLGDDIPSIFPIVAGVLLFITALMYANDQMHERDNYLRLKKAGLELSYAALDKGYVSTQAFHEKCNNSVKQVAKKNGVFFALVLKNCEVSAIDKQRLADGAPANPFLGTPVCNSEGIVFDEPAQTTDITSHNYDGYGPRSKPNDFIALSYPVATDCAGGTTGLGMMNIITWYQ